MTTMSQLNSTARKKRRDDTKVHEYKNVFEDKLDKAGLCYFENPWYMSQKLPRTVFYTLYLGREQDDYRERTARVKVLLKCQDNLRNSKKAPDGYLILNLREVLSYVPHSEMQSTILCVYVNEIDKFFIKPIRFLKSYLEKVTKPRSQHAVRINPLLQEPQKKIKKSLETGKVYEIDLSNPVKPISISPTYDIHNKLPYLIRGHEFFNAISEWSKYDDLWKLKFKTFKNLIIKELL